MIIIDSVGWISYIKGEALSDKYGFYIDEPSDIIVPTVVIYEVYKKIKNDIGWRDAYIAYAYISTTVVIPLNDAIAISAASLSLEHKLPLADAIIYATARYHEVDVVTSDKHFEGLDGVVYIA